MKALIVLGSSAWLLQFTGCFQASDGGTSVFPIGWLYSFFRGAAT